MGNVNSRERQEHIQRHAGTKTNICGESQAVRDEVWLNEGQQKDWRPGNRQLSMPGQENWVIFSIQW